MPVHCILPCKHSTKTLVKKQYRVYYDATFATVSQQTKSHLPHIQNAGGTFPFLLPILGSGNPYTCGQIITGYSNCTCITQDLGFRPYC